MGPTIADLLKEQGYATGQFGKNHLGDRDKHLPTVHGFDEFFGNLYHLNAEEEPETYYYPKDPAFRKNFGPRGVLHAVADGKGGQKVEDTGPLTRARMPTVDQEIYDHATSSSTKRRRTRSRSSSGSTARACTSGPISRTSAEGRTGIGLYPDGMVEHDDMVGQLLKKLDDLGITDNTIVVYGTDNGAETVTWPDGGMTPFHGEKGTTWEGGLRVPMLVRWPGVIKPGTIVNDIVAQEDWMPTLLAAAGEPDIVEKLKKGYKANGRTSRSTPMATTSCHFFKGEAKKAPREENLLFRPGRRAERRPLERLESELRRRRREISRLALRNVTGWPVIVNLRADPYEKTPCESGDVSPLVRRQHLALRTGATEAQGIFRDDSAVSLSGGNQPERSQHQLQTRSRRCRRSRNWRGWKPSGIRVTDRQAPCSRPIAGCRGMTNPYIRVGEVIMKQGIIKALFFAVAQTVLYTAIVHAADPLPSWNDGPTKKAIVEFVSKVTQEGGPDFVPPGGTHRHL